MADKKPDAQSDDEFIESDVVRDYVRDVAVDVMNLMNKRMRDDMGSPSARIGAQIAGLASVLCLLIARSSDEDFEQFYAGHKDLWDELTSSDDYKEYVAGNGEIDFEVETTERLENGDEKRESRQLRGEGTMTHIWKRKPNETIH
tara:strand:- start:1440 stop:1874 length:435 start_codon:yes stop_codon:yes gene_type:complete